MKTNSNKKKLRNKDLFDGAKAYRIEELIMHGLCVSNLAFLIAKELKCDDQFCHDVAMAGLVHDIGKVKIYGYIYNESSNEQMNIQKMRYIRMHSELGYDILAAKGFNEEVLRAVLYHHENYDGSGYPANLAGESIPLSARILRVCDVFAALTSDRSYRNAFDVDTAIELMIDEVKNFDMHIFLIFMKVIHEVDLNRIMGR
ncbi:MAG: HD domain-containing protein [Lachnospiraceae bacterium]|nr:HD domain-containing protein [Lachnospiraceae bacterium]